MKTAPIGELTESVTNWNPSREPDRAFDYIDLSAVDSSSKSVTGVTRTVGSAAPSRARQLVAAGDVLVSTVRPNLNAVAVVPPELDGATASTGFTVLRPSLELHGRFLFHWVRTPAFIGDMVRKATGASYPAVSDRIVKGSQILAPPFPEQRRIAAILDQADALRTKRRQVLGHLDELPQSIFVDLFGDPSRWGKRWEIGTIGDLAASVNYGTAGKAGTSGRWPILRMGNVTDDGRLDLRDLKFIELGDGDVAKYTAKRGDMLFNRTNSKEKVGKSAVVRTDRPLAVAGYLVRVRFESSATAEFVSAYLTSRHGLAVRQRMAKAAVNQANISASEMRKIWVAHPPTDVKHAFEEQVLDVDRQRALVHGALTIEDGLFASIQSRAFKGTL